MLRSPGASSGANEGRLPRAEEVDGWRGRLGCRAASPACEAGAPGEAVGREGREEDLAGTRGGERSGFSEGQLCQGGTGASGAPITFSSESLADR